MRRPKRLTRKQKFCLSANSLNWKEWMLVEETDSCYRIIHKDSGIIKDVDKSRKRRR